MSEQILCTECGKVVRTVVREVQETYPVKGEPITVDAKVRFCNECHESIFDMVLDKNNLVTAFNLYRSRHNLLTPEEIKRIRKKYNLTQKSLAIILGWGEKTVTRYENGSIQEQSHNNMLKIIEDKDVFKRLWDMNKKSLGSQKEIDSIDELLKEGSDQQLNNSLHFEYSPSQLSGFVAINYELTQKNINQQIGSIVCFYKPEFLKSNLFDNVEDNNEYEFNVEQERMCLLQC